MNSCHIAYSHCCDGVGLRAGQAASAAANTSLCNTPWQFSLCLIIFLSFLLFFFFFNHYSSGSTHLALKVCLLSLYAGSLMPGVQLLSSVRVRLVYLAAFVAGVVESSCSCYGYSWEESEEWKRPYVGSGVVLCHRLSGVLFSSLWALPSYLYISWNGKERRAEAGN